MFDLFNIAGYVEIEETPPDYKALFHQITEEIVRLYAVPKGEFDNEVLNLRVEILANQDNRIYHAYNEAKILLEGMDYNLEMEISGSKLRL